MSSNTRLKKSSNYLKAPQPHYTKVLQGLSSVIFGKLQSG